MANTQSAKKAIRSSAKKREHNAFWLRRISAAEKAINKLVQGDAGADILKGSLTALQKIVDKAAKEKVLPKNRAARLKSRMAKKINANAPKQPKPSKPTEK